MTKINNETISVNNMSLFDYSIKKEICSINQYTFSNVCNTNNMPKLYITQFTKSINLKKIIVSGFTDNVVDHSTSNPSILKVTGIITTQYDVTENKKYTFLIDDLFTNQTYNINK